MPRRYSEEQAQRIFALVADRQRLGPGDADGLSLSELEEAARAAGLDPSLVAAAAAQIDAAPGDDRTLLGAPVEVVRQRMIAGEVDDETWTRMVHALRAEFGDAGMAGQVGRLREWTLISGGTKHGTSTRLAVEPTADGTRITLTRSVKDSVFGFQLAAAIMAGMSLLFGGIALAAIEPALWIPFGIMLGMGLAFGAGSQIGTRMWHRHTATRFEGLLDRLELVARDAAPARAATAEAPHPRTETPRLGLDLDGPEVEEGVSSGRSRTRA